MPPKRTKRENTLAFLYPNLAKQWDKQKNFTTPERVTPDKELFVWWICPIDDCGFGCKHTWCERINVRVRNQKCPHCTNESSSLCIHKSPKHAMEKFIYVESVSNEILRYLAGDPCLHSFPEIFETVFVHKYGPTQYVDGEPFSFLDPECKIIHSFNDRPAVIGTYKKAEIQTWYRNGVIHRDNKPAQIADYGYSIEKSWVKFGEGVDSELEAVESDSESSYGDPYD